MLGAFRYSRNETVLHTDTSVLPRAEGARASWNLLRVPGESKVLVSYDMTRLMRLAGPGRPTSSRSTRPTGSTRPRSSRAWTTSTPTYTPESVAAQHRLPGLNDDRLAFAGAYHGWGFHEDGCASGVRAAAALGVTW